eukprot:scaffold142163_cov28-Tisochrysis_lutea.AAC.1
MAQRTYQYNTKLKSRRIIQSHHAAAAVRDRRSKWCTFAPQRVSTTRVSVVRDPCCRNRNLTEPHGGAAGRSTKSCRNSGSHSVTCGLRRGFAASDEGAAQPQRSCCLIPSDVRTFRWTPERGLISSMRRRTACERCGRIQAWRIAGTSPPGEHPAQAGGE